MDQGDFESRATLAITTGDPGGIGPEVVVKAVYGDGGVAGRAGARLVVLGSRVALERAAARAGLRPTWEVAGRDDRGAWPGSAVVVVDHPCAEEALRPEPSAAGGAASFALVERAIELARLGAGEPRRVDGIVTGPISKKAWQLAGHGDYPGHTELLAARLGAARHGMMFFSPPLRVILATAHVPLARVPEVLTTARVLEAIRLGHEACVRVGAAVEGGFVDGADRPRIAVCGLNPHAGEGGLLGAEDDRVIAPAIEAARREGIDAHGPLPGDTVWTAAARPPLGRGRYDLVVAMYHDQGLIPVKLAAWDRAVNVTVGLPTVRTSPDHGTAFDIAGRNVADAGSMRAAIELAGRMVGAHAKR